MGRYISGDIDHKLWFAVQSSDDADFFGVQGTQPEELCYTYNKSDMSSIIRGIAECKQELGTNLSKLKKFFDTHDFYSDDEIEKLLGVDQDEVLSILKWYARYRLGIKIKDCVEEQDYCDFTAEL